MNRNLGLFALIVATCLPGLAMAGVVPEGRVTQTTNDVQLRDGTAASRPVSINEKLPEKSVIVTGAHSRAEITFSDRTVVRLAADTSLGLEPGARDLILEKGAVLIEAPKRARVAKIHAGPAIAAVAGTTAMLEHHPKVCKYLVLQGTGRLYRPKHWGDSILVRPGQMTIGDPDSDLSDPVDFDIARFMKTSRFFVDLPPLQTEQLIAAETKKQLRDKSKKVLIDTNLIIYGGGTMVSLVDPAKLDMGNVQTTKAADPNPSPSPSSTENNPSQ